METSLVSVVVPIYNVEKYLDRCISSIVRQTYGNLEIILVDDGSPDHCPEMCEQWAEKDNRIRVVHKKNGGLGMARNTGIDHATGEYICFFDSDDYIEPNAIEVCMRTVKNEAADIVAFGNDKVTREGKVLATRIPTPPKYIFTGEEVVKTLLPKSLYYNPQTGENWNLSLAAWAGLFAMKLIHKNQWRFVSEREIICEDYYSLLELYSYADKVVILNEVLYHYVVNPASLTQTYREDRYQKLVYFYQQLLERSTQMGILPHVRTEASAVFAGLSIGCFKQIVASSESIADKIRKIRSIMDDLCLQDVLKNGDFSGDPAGKRVLWYAIKNKKFLLCYLIVKMRNFKDKVRK